MADINGKFNSTTPRKHVLSIGDKVTIIGADDPLLNGDAVLRYEVQKNTTYAKSMAFPVEFEDHKAWAINKALSNSKVFEVLEKAEDRPLWILFSHKAGLWRYSLYSAPDSGLDVSKIAVKYGGGGHAGAAGFQSDKYLLTEIVT